VVTNGVPLPSLDEWSKPWGTFTRWCLGPTEPTRFILPSLRGLGTGAHNSGSIAVGCVTDKTNKANRRQKRRQRKKNQSSSLKKYYVIHRPFLT
jgi:hypothetical protein